MNPWIGALFAILSIALFLALVRSRKPKPTRVVPSLARYPETETRELRTVTSSAVISTVIANWDRMDEAAIGKAEWQLRSSPDWQKEADLLYALRVSRTVGSITRLKTLAARWNIAHSGAGGAGLFAALGAPDYVEVERFLGNLYGERLLVITDDILIKAEALANARKSDKACGNAWSRCGEKIALETGFIHGDAFGQYTTTLITTADERARAAYMGRRIPTPLDLDSLHRRLLLA